MRMQSEYKPFSTSMSRWIVICLLLTLALVTLCYTLIGDLANYIYFVGMLLIIIILRRAKRISLTFLIGRLPTSYSWLGILMIALVLLTYASGAIILVVYPLTMIDAELVSEFLVQPLGNTPVHAFVMTVLLAPVLEETVFRGLLFTRMAAKWGMTAGVIVSSLLFGILHFEFLVGAFVIGVVVCVMYVRSKTLLIPMAIHGLYNLFIWLITILSEGQEFVPSTVIAEGYVYQGLVAVMISSPVIFLLLGRWWPKGETLLPYDLNAKGSKAKNTETWLLTNPIT